MALKDPQSHLVSIRQLYRDRKSTRLNSSHSQISYAVFCLKKKIANIEVVVAVFSSTSFPAPHPSWHSPRHLPFPFVGPFVVHNGNALTQFPIVSVHKLPMS